jgi:hypothetical protein
VTRKNFSINMATTSDRVYSETLQSIINAKLDELEKKRSGFESSKEALLDDADQQVEEHDKLRTLLNGIKSCFKVRSGSNGRIIAGSMKDSQLELKLNNLERFLEQTRYDPSVSLSLLHDWEDVLTQQLDVQSSRYEYASLYGQLVTEWLSNEKGMKPDRASGGDLEMSEGYEEIESRAKQESRGLWAKTVFEPLETDTNKIQSHLHKIFGENEPDRSAFKALKKLRAELATFENNLLRPNQFSVPTLRWVIKGVLGTELLDESKRTVLRDLESNHVILSELADVLNLRMSSLDTWSWGDKVPVSESRLVSGAYNMHMQEDLLQAILLQYIGVKWSVFFKKSFEKFIKHEGAWASSRREMPILDKKRRDYFLGSCDTVPSVNSKRERLWRSRYFMSQLWNHEEQDIILDDGAEEAEFAQAPSSVERKRKRTLQTARKSTGGMAPRKQMAAAPAQRSVVQQPQQAGLFGQAYQAPPPPPPAQSYQSRSYDSDDDNGLQAYNPMERKQRLLHLLSTEILMNKYLHGDFTCFRAQFENWNPLLPHSTIMTVLSYLGVSSTWLRFIATFLAAPLALENDGEDEMAKPRNRKRGVPASHPLSTVLGEVVLFCMDLTVNQATSGHNLWRLHDDFWFWAVDHGTCVKAWSAVTEFTSNFGLDLSEDKCGTVRIAPSSAKPPLANPGLPQGEIRWGFLTLSPQSGRFEIDQALVTDHINSLRSQLAPKTSSVFAWVQAWNAYAGTFFSTNFGKPANCFGQAHIDNILSTLKRVQTDVFRSANATSHTPDQPGSVVEYLQNTLHGRFNVQHIPEGYVFFPAELGGLDLRNPLIDYLQIRDSVTKDPSALFAQFEEAERDDYRTAEQAYHRDNAGGYATDFPHFVPAEGRGGAFMSFEEYARYREDLHYGFTGELLDVFDELLEQPKQESIEVPSELMTALGLMDTAGVVNSCGINGSWHRMSAYWKWVVGVYGPEIVRRFGGLNIVDNGVLPVGMVGLVKDKRVKWSD